MLGRRVVRDMCGDVLAAISLVGDDSLRGHLKTFAIRGLLDSGVNTSHIQLWDN